jgi:hypothetical protein
LITIAGSRQHERQNGVVASDSLRPVTLAELVATLSVVADLGMGRPMERVLRQTVIAMRLGGGGRDRSGDLHVGVLHLAADVGELCR